MMACVCLHPMASAIHSLGREDCSSNREGIETFVRMPGVQWYYSSTLDRQLGCPGSIAGRPLTLVLSFYTTYPQSCHEEDRRQGTA